MIKMCSISRSVGNSPGTAGPNMLPVSDGIGPTSNLLPLSGNNSPNLNMVSSRTASSGTPIASNSRVNRRLFTGPAPVSIVCTAATTQSSNFGTITTVASGTATPTNMINLCNPQGPNLMANSTNTLVQQQQDSVTTNQCNSVANPMVASPSIDNSAISNTTLSSNVEEPDLGFSFDNRK